ncbi:hypothetical protein BU25DRAFT_37037 [Macroventuria anomochaeta]|uniref:Uncharacterized protein n=1 Tax=Macroventuria anomochaeta TaxID=301207 RepID=A0ACB6S2I9_9PLEO|nr:uncharacterized protein BU25DRAFT_37037 [Macroventuria anomochaeta]KAF2628491.1 hypothetical protein BU25DRAFT_37037 [Macroventuria anomochaeta]
MPTSSHQRRTHIIRPCDVTNAHSQIARSFKQPPTSMLSTSLFRSVDKTTIFVYFALHFAYTLSVSCIWVALRPSAQDHTGACL